jgi:DMSO/TMAO reductase YedYZ heme-binding membrane subunit
MLAAAISSSPRAFWYLTRGTGVVTLVLFTLTVTLGIANYKRLETRRIPRFVIDGVHRNAALLAVIFLSIHILTTLLDQYVPIHLIDVIVPFGAAYKPVWLGLGAIAFDLMIAVALTSAVRRRLGYQTWRAVHWLAYAAWPVALIHGLGMGTDRHTHWMLAVTGGCVVLVGLALLARLGTSRESAVPRPSPARERLAALERGL